MILDRTLLILTLVSTFFLAFGAANIRIRPSTCSNALGQSGTCMFVWQCIKSGGDQLGTCVDGFLVGTCCRTPEVEDNLIELETKTKPVTVALTTTTTTKAATVTLPTVPSTDRPIVQVHVGQSAGEQTVIAAVNPINASTVLPTGEDYSECGISDVKTRSRVVGGQTASFGQFPWQVSVRKASFFGFASVHRCGGAIINANWIVTAAHCVDDVPKNNIRIRVGEYDFSTVDEPRPHQERSVTKKIVHSQYNFFNFEYDLALLRLDSPLVLQPHVRPICLPPDDPSARAELIGMNATVTGWGRLSEGGALPNKLQYVDVPILSNIKCQGMFEKAGRKEAIPDIFICAGYEEGGRDSCQGDSGGPLQTKGKDGRYFLAGIISWGIGCAEANMPGVCIRIDMFKDWMLESIS